MRSAARSGSCVDARGLALLWAALSAGPLGWALYQGIGYALVKPVCAERATYVLWLLAVGAFALAAAGGGTAWCCVRQLHQTAAEDGGSVRDRSYFMAMLGIALNALIAVLIVAALIPQSLLDPCE